MADPKRTRIKVDASPEEVEIFDDLQEWLGATSRAEVQRWLIQCGKLVRRLCGDETPRSFVAVIDGGPIGWPSCVATRPRRSAVEQRLVEGLAAARE